MGKVFTSIVLSLSFLTIPAAVEAISVSYTSYIGTGSADCATSGYISPSTNSANSGDQLTITFRNEKTTPLQIRGIPGGNFNVAGGADVAKSFTANETINLSAWKTDGTCQKATAVINVAPPPEPVPPVASPTPAPSPTPTPQSNSPSNLSSDSAQSQPEATSSEATPQPGDDSIEEQLRVAETRSFGSWLLLAISYLLVGLVIYLGLARIFHWWPFRRSLLKK